MAAARSKGQQPIGSAQWIHSERQQAEQFVTQEVEEFGFSARNELEWLNEHMAEIFSREQRNFTDVFKTPSKLRGKTPRTARKKDAQRAPLTDIFAPNPQSILSPSQKTPFFNKVAKFQVAEDEPQSHQPQSNTRHSPARVGKGNTDSGYHGMTEDEMDPASSQAREVMPQAGRIEEMQPQNTEKPDPSRLQVHDRNTEDSFVSAKEGLVSQQPSRENLRDEVDDNATVPDEEMQIDASPDENIATEEPQVQDEPEIAICEDRADQDMPEATSADLEAENEASVVSDVSSPEKPLLRKSSLNFAALPPRETLTGKRSLGPQGSQMAAQQSLNNAVADARPEDMEDEDDDLDINSAPLEENVAAVHNKTSTQLLHERINMLGQSKETKPSGATSTDYPRLPSVSQPFQNASTQDADMIDDDDVSHNEDDDDDWIAPIPDRPSTSSTVEEKPSHVPEPLEAETASLKPRYGHQKSISTTDLVSPSKAAMAPELRHQKSMSVSQPNLAQAQSTTPFASPSKRVPDGALSASKSKLYSVLKSAKSMFAGSASASAQAKMEALSSPVARQEKQAVLPQPAVSRMPGGFDADPFMVPKTTNRPISIISTSTAKTERKTRSSSESDKKREREAKEQQRAADDLDKIREKERKKATEQKQQREEDARLEKDRAETISRANSQRTVTEDPFVSEDVQPPSTTKSMLPPGKLRAPTRLGRPTKQPVQQAPKPVPVNIRVASQSQRLGSAQPAASTVHDPIPPPAGTRQQTATTRAGAAGTRAGSAQPSNARVKALEAAARKKEQEDKVAERKAEQKREFERKRAARAEEERKLEQERKAAEQQRAQEVRMAAQRQAEQKKLEQQRLQAAAERARADAELATALEREKAQASAPPPRGDVQGTLRQLGKTTVALDMPMNQAKPVKRQLDGEEGSARPGLPRNPPSYTQKDAKRRKTNDEDDIELHERHSVMAPPKRPSNMRKEPQPKFPHGYAHAPPPAAHHTQNMFKATLTAQHQMQHNGKAPIHPTDTVKLSTARIPFAENANPPPSNHNFHPSASTSAFKTPARPAQTHTLKSAHTPTYPNGENIALPEINTDSEDSDSEADNDDENATGTFRAPSWVASPALRELLTQQQLVDPESIFGPIEPLQMDEVFKNGKNAERMKRFRDRGESALWTESGDAVTSAEKRRDREARARVVRDGGWSFQRDV